MLEFLKKHDLSVGSLSVCRILECIEVFFQCIELATSPILHFPHYTVSSTAYFFRDLEAFTDMGLNFLVITHNNYQ